MSEDLISRTASPYEGVPVEEWRKVTDELLRQHPLKPDDLWEVAQISWDALWRTTLGGVIPFSDESVQIPAQMVGTSFELLFCHFLHRRKPEWRRGTGKKEKDLVCQDGGGRFDVELKTSGQKQLAVFGNRSFAQVESGKSKSGYFLTINHHRKRITLLRFGWIDAADWKSQKSSSGQQATLHPDVYLHKLRVIPGPYQRLAVDVLFVDARGRKRKRVDSYLEDAFQKP